MPAGRSLSHELSERVRSAADRPQLKTPPRGERPFGQRRQRASVSRLRAGRLQVRTRPRLPSGGHAAGPDGTVRRPRHPRARGRAVRKRGGPCVLPSSFGSKPPPPCQLEECQKEPSLLALFSPYTISTSRTRWQRPGRRRCTGWQGPSWLRGASSFRAAG